MSVIPSVAQLCKFAKLFSCVLSMWYTISLMQIGEIVGAWLSNYRAEKKLTLEQIADASQRYGSGWAASTVSRMEKGSSKGDSLTALIILLATLNDLTGDRLTLADVFIDYGSSVNIGNYKTSYENIVYALQGRTVSFSATHDDLKQDLYKIMREEGIEQPENGVDLGTFMISDTAQPRIDTSKTPAFIINHYDTAAEKRLQQRIISGPKGNHKFDTEDDENVSRWVVNTLYRYGLDTSTGFMVGAVCDVLYGHSLDEEAAKRAGEGATPQKRGRVTRVLAGEILDYMRKVAAKLED